MVNYAYGGKQISRQKHSWTGISNFPSSTLENLLTVCLEGLSYVMKIGESLARTTERTYNASKS